MKVYDIVNETVFRMSAYPGFSWDDKTNTLTRPDGTTIQANNAAAARRQASNWSRRTSRNVRAALTNYRRNANSQRLQLDDVKGTMPKLVVGFLKKLSGIFGRSVPWILLLEDLLDDFYGIVVSEIEAEQQRVEQEGGEFDTTAVTSRCMGMISAHFIQAGPAIFRQVASQAAALYVNAKIAKRVISAIMWIIRGFGLSTGPGAIIVAGGTALVQIGLGWYITTDSGKQWIREAWVWVMETALPILIGGMAELAIMAGFETAEGLGDAAISASESAADLLKTNMERQAEAILAGMDEFGAEPSEVPELPDSAEDGDDSEQPDRTPAPVTNRSFRDIVGSGTW